MNEFYNNVVNIIKILFMSTLLKKNINLQATMIFANEKFGSCRLDLV